MEWWPFDYRRRIHSLHRLDGVAFALALTAVVVVVVVDANVIILAIFVIAVKFIVSLLIHNSFAMHTEGGSWIEWK